MRSGTEMGLFLRLFLPTLGKNGYRKTSCNSGLLPLVGRLKFNGHLKQYFSLYQAISQRGRKKKKGNR